MTNIHAIILTFNEEMHIARCIKSIKDQCKTITVVDSNSTDKTIEIARSLGAKILVNDWVNYATQMNYSINAVANQGGWLLRIDADEVFESRSEILTGQFLDNLEPEIDGILVQRRIHFLGKRIKYGTIEPSWQLRLWRNGKGQCEQRWMDEHIKVEGRVQKSNFVLSDINLNSLTWWTDKHNSYASREAIDILNRKFCFLPEDKLNDSGASRQAKLKRFIKENIYNKLPTGIRALAYFFYRYILHLGFLDGKPGFYFHLLQGLWYRTLVDAKVVEITAYSKKHNISIPDAIKKCTGFDPYAAN